jgi:hypothetical protein
MASLRPIHTEYFRPGDRQPARVARATCAHNAAIAAFRRLLRGDFARAKVEADSGTSYLVLWRSGASVQMKRV